MRFQGPHQTTAKRFCDQIQSRLPESRQVDDSQLGIGRAKPDFVWLREARWDYAIGVLPINVDYTQSEESSSSCSDGKLITTTIYVSRTQIEAGLTGWRVSDGARCFYAQGMGCQSDSESEDGKFPFWLIKALFFSADYPDFPDALVVSRDLCAALLDVLLTPPDR